MENEELKKDDKIKETKVVSKEKRVGTYTFGVMLILIGISVIVMTFTKLDFIKYMLMLWPVVLIGLGIEILYLNSRSDVKVKIDFVSFILMCIVLFCTAIFSVGNYFVNKVLSDEQLKNRIYNEYFDYEYKPTVTSNSITENHIDL